MQKKATSAKRRNDVLLIVLLVLSLALVGKVVYDVIEKIKLIEENEAKQAELLSTYQQLDSIQQVVKDKIRTIQSLGGLIDTLHHVRDALQEEKIRLHERNREEIAVLKKKVEGYTSLLFEKDAKIKRLRKVNNLLQGENTDLKYTQNKLKRSISSLKKHRKKLQAKVNIASRLKISTPTVTGLGRRGQTLRKLRAKRVKILKISFHIEANEVAEADGKEILLRIVAPNKKSLFDVKRGAGSFFINGKEHFYTHKQDILYDTKRQEITFLYEKQSKYMRGLYQVEIYTEGYLLGSGSFEIK